MKHPFRLILCFGYILCTALFANATKPCPPHPCKDSSGVFQEAKCRAAADWVAIGTITSVVHDRQGHPLNKDFASFIFKPTKWEKGEQVQTTEISYKVGWCSNRTELPADLQQKFRFYGVSSDGSRGENLYLEFRPVRK